MNTKAVMPITDDTTAMKGDQEFYCKMVQEKAWPDYRGIAAAECK